MADVFISYKREERSRCQLIHDKLVDLRFSVWFDAKLENGRNFNEETYVEVRTAKCVLALWSPLSVESQWVQSETMIGFEEKKLAAAFIEKAEPRTPFNLSQAADLTGFKGGDGHSGWLEVLERIGNLTGRKTVQHFSQLLAKADVNGIAEWAQENYADPLADTAVPWAADVLQKRISKVIETLSGKTDYSAISRPGNERFFDAGRSVEEEQNWQEICDSPDVRDFIGHLEMFPDGKYAAECKRVLVRLMADQS